MNHANRLDKKGKIFKITQGRKLLTIIDVVSKPTAKVLIQITETTQAEKLTATQSESNN